MALATDVPGPSAAVTHRRCEVREYRGQPTPEARVPTHNTPVAASDMHRDVVARATAASVSTTPIEVSACAAQPGGWEPEPVDREVGVPGQARPSSGAESPRGAGCDSGGWGPPSPNRRSRKMQLRQATLYS